MPKTIKTLTPAPPAWVTKAGAEAIRAWESSLSWRADAAQATTKQYRQQLIRDAKRDYPN